MKKNTQQLGAAFALALIVPAVAHAQAPQTFTDVILIFIDLLKIIIPLIGAAALVVFLWGLVKFIAVADNEKGRVIGRQLMIWGIIGLFVITTIWGILAFLSSELGFNQGGGIGITTLPE